MENAISDYLRSLLPEKEPWEKTLEQQALKEHIPIMEPESMAFVKQLVRIKRPDAILEIGTGIGYSSLQMHHAHPLAKIVTIERDTYRYTQANKHINTQQKGEQIHVIHGDALEVLADLRDHTFDIVFIDAAKGQYKRMFEQMEPFLNKNGLIISDNVLFKGYVAGGNAGTNKRYEKLAKKMQSYNTWLTEQTYYDTSIVPIGDGVAVSLKK